MTHESAPRLTEQRLPNGWRETALYTVADVRFSSVDKLAQTSEQPIRLCNYIDVYKNDYITGDLEFMEASATQPEIDRFGLKVGDVIITKDSETPNDIGVSAVVDYAAPDLVCGYHLGLIRPNQSNVDSTFLAKQLAHHRIAKYFGRQANGLTRYGLPLNAVMNAPLLLPERGEQEAIGALLRLVDKAIVTTEAVIAKLKQVHIGLVHDLLTRGLVEHSRLRPPPSETPHLYKDSPLGKIPREWSFRTIAETASPSENSFVDGDWIEAPHIRTEGIRLVQTGNIGVGEFLDKPDGRKFISERSFAALRCKTLAKDDILICRLAEPVGRACLLPDFVGPAITSVDVTIFRPSQSILSRQFAVWQLNTHATLNHCGLLAGGTTRKRISRINLGRIPISVPPLLEQESICKVLDRICEQISREGCEHAKLGLLKSGLMADLLTGHVRVPENTKVSQP